MIDGWMDIIRDEIATVASMRNWKGTVVATSYDPTKHAIRGVLVPHEVETGWIPIGTGAIGNGYGDLMGPKVGSADTLDGDQFNVEFDSGDPNTPIATHRIFSDVDVPPQVQSGEMLRQHSTGTKVFLAQDGSATMQHGPTQASVVIDKDGNITHDAKGQNVTVQTSGQGNVAVTTSGQGSVSVSASKGTLNLSGQAIALTGPATLNGQPIQTA